MKKYTPETKLNPCIVCGKLVHSDGTEMCCRCYSQWKENLPEENAKLKEQISELEKAIRNLASGIAGCCYECGVDPIDCPLSICGEADDVNDIIEQIIRWAHLPENHTKEQ